MYSFFSPQARLNAEGLMSLSSLAIYVGWKNGAWINTEFTTITADQVTFDPLYAESADPDLCGYLYRGKV